LIMRKQVGRTQADKIAMRRMKLDEHDRGGDRVATVKGDGSMQTYGVCSALDRFWAHVTRVGWWRSWCGG
jgi:hypothetical protein